MTHDDYVEYARLILRINDLLDKVEECDVSDQMRVKFYQAGILLNRYRRKQASRLLAAETQGD